jgi:adenylate cyclase
MPDAHEDIAAWLEDADRKSHPIRGACSLGRSASNQVPLPDERVSRRHAVIQSQLEDEFWLVDFGSRNGSYVNDIRVAQPTRLRNGDVVRIGPFQLVFRQQAAAHSSASPTLGSSLTVTDFKLETYWLLVADIIDSSKLAQQLPRDELPLVTGRWVSECKQTIESVGGRINQFMGDGFFACWRDHDRIAVSIHKAIEALLRLQQEAKPAFRFVVHLGDVTIGGVSVGEEERISGSTVHFVFRQEKLAAKLGQARLMSEPAWNRLAALVEARSMGRHTLPGFDGDFLFYTF